jgi:hypothetical protein
MPELRIRLDALRMVSRGELPAAHFLIDLQVQDLIDWRNRLTERGREALKAAGEGEQHA